jgi:hypothetical protein
VFLMRAILRGVKRDLSMDLICISFMARDIEHFFVCFFVHLDFFGQVTIKIPPHSCLLQHYSQ